MMEKMEVWMTADGRQFTDEKEAARHERFLSMAETVSGYAEALVAAGYSKRSAVAKFNAVMDYLAWQAGEKIPPAPEKKEVEQAAAAA